MPDRSRPAFCLCAAGLTAPWREPRGHSSTQHRYQGQTDAESAQSPVTGLLQVEDVASEQQRLSLACITAASSRRERPLRPATALGLRRVHLNQPVEAAQTRPQFQSLLALGGRRPDMVLRFGYAPPMPRSLRLPLAAVIDAWQGGWMINHPVTHDGSPYGGKFLSN